MDFLLSDNTVVDFFGGLRIDQLGDQGKRKGDCASRTAAGRDIAVDDDRIKGDIRAGELFFKTGIAAGFFAL